MPVLVVVHHDVLLLVPLCRFPNQHVCREVWGKAKRQVCRSDPDVCVQGLYFRYFLVQGKRSEHATCSPVAPICYINHLWGNLQVVCNESGVEV